MEIPENPSPDPNPAPAAPPAAATVNAGSRTEREIQLEDELGRERETRKAREIRLSELEDENHRLKTPPVEHARPVKGMWDEFFEED